MCPGPTAPIKTLDLTHQHTTEIISTPQRSLCTTQKLQHLPSIPTSPTACCADSGMGAETASGRSRRWGRRHPCRWPGGGDAGRAGGASESPRAECRGHDFPSLGGMGSRAARFRKRMGKQKATRRDAAGDKQACGADEGVEELGNVVSPVAFTAATTELHHRQPTPHPPTRGQKPCNQAYAQQHTPIANCGAFHERPLWGLGVPPLSQIGGDMKPGDGRGGDLNRAGDRKPDGGSCGNRGKIDNSFCHEHVSLCREDRMCFEQVPKRENGRSVYRVMRVKGAVCKFDEWIGALTKKGTRHKRQGAPGVCRGVVAVRPAVGVCNRSLSGERTFASSHALCRTNDT